MNALLVVFAKVPEKHLEITIAADARRQYIPSFAQRRSTLSKATSKNLSKMMNKKVHSKKCVDDDVEMVEEEEVVTIETINDLCAQLHQMSAKVQKFKCDGDEFSGVASKFSDLSSTLRLSYKRLESNRVANKRRMHLVKRLCFLSSMGTVSKCT